MSKSEMMEKIDMQIIYHEEQLAKYKKVKSVLSENGQVEIIADRILKALEESQMI